MVLPSGEFQLIKPYISMDAFGVKHEYYERLTAKDLTKLCYTITPNPTLIKGFIPIFNKFVLPQITDIPKLGEIEFDGAGFIPLYAAHPGKECRTIYEWFDKRSRAEILLAAYGIYDLGVFDPEIDFRRSAINGEIEHDAYNVIEVMFNISPSGMWSKRLTVKESRQLISGRRDKIIAAAYVHMASHPTFKRQGIPIEFYKINWMSVTSDKRLRMIFTFKEMPKNV